MREDSSSETVASGNESRAAPLELCSVGRKLGGSLEIEEEVQEWKI